MRFLSKIDQYTVTQFLSSVLSLLGYNTPTHCRLKVAKHLIKNKDYYHHNANEAIWV